MILVVEAINWGEKLKCFFKGALVKKFWSETLINLWLRRKILIYLKLMLDPGTFSGIFSLKYWRSEKSWRFCLCQLCWHDRQLIRMSWYLIFKSMVDTRTSGSRKVSKFPPEVGYLYYNDAFRRALELANRFCGSTFQLCSAVSRIPSNIANVQLHFIHNSSGIPKPNFLTESVPKALKPSNTSRWTDSLKQSKVIK